MSAYDRIFRAAIHTHKVANLLLHTHFLNPYQNSFEITYRHPATTLPKSEPTAHKNQRYAFFSLGNLCFSDTKGKLTHFLDGMTCGVGVRCTTKFTYSTLPIYAYIAFYMCVKSDSWHLFLHHRGFNDEDIVRVPKMSVPLCVVVIISHIRSIHTLHLLRLHHISHDCRKHIRIAQGGS